MWAESSVFYQIFTLGFCGAPFANEENSVDQTALHRIRKVNDWIPHMKKLGIDAVYFCPLFESDTHGYNTRDYKKIDVRLGTNEDFRDVCRELHKNGIRVVLDGVFNHVGRGFVQFRDVQRNRENSRYKDWFHIHFGGNSNYNDGFWYEGWEGNYDLVKLNLRNEEVIAHIFDAVRYWVEYFDIDGLRLDVAYCLDRDFIRRLRSFTDSLKEDFFLVGEILGGDYKVIMGADKLHSATNYECYKGLHSSFNSLNMFEIIHSLIRQFGSDPWTLYPGAHLLSFVDNHDVSRIATTLTDPKHLPLMPCASVCREFPVSTMEVNGEKRGTSATGIPLCALALKSRSGTACATGSADLPGRKRDLRLCVREIFGVFCSPISSVYSSERVRVNASWSPSMPIGRNMWPISMPDAAWLLT